MFAMVPTMSKLTGAPEFNACDKAVTRKMLATTYSVPFDMNYGIAAYRLIDKEGCTVCPIGSFPLTYSPNGNAIIRACVPPVGLPPTSPAFFKCREKNQKVRKVNRKKVFVQYAKCMQPSIVPETRCFPAGAQDYLHKPNKPGKPATCARLGLRRDSIDFGSYVFKARIKLRLILACNYFKRVFCVSNTKRTRFCATNKMISFAYADTCLVRRGDVYSDKKLTKAMQSIKATSTNATLLSAALLLDKEAPRKSLFNPKKCADAYMNNGVGKSFGAQDLHYCARTCQVTNWRAKVKAYTYATYKGKTKKRNGLYKRRLYMTAEADSKTLGGHSHKQYTQKATLEKLPRPPPIQVAVAPKGKPLWAGVAQLVGDYAGKEAKVQVEEFAKTSGLCKIASMTL